MRPNRRPEADIDIRCPACGRPVSIRLEICPHCEYGLQ
ncbi:MAG: zinc ribbon domain-containing protein [Halobacteriales archaeon]